MIRVDQQFTSGGQRCEAWLYLPDANGQYPCIVFAHGIGAVRQVRVRAYAERFTRAGYAVFAFDYRHWGASEGTPRFLCTLRDQQRDIHAAIDHVRTLEAIVPDKVVLLGTSFGGGHALVVGAERPDLAAVIAQCPIVDSLAVAASTPPSLTLRWIMAGLDDKIRALIGSAPRYIKLAGEPGELALMSAPGAEASYLAMIDGPSPWRNSIAARFILDIPLFRPIRYSHKIEANLLIVVTDKDEICPPSLMARAARLAPNGKAVHFDSGHFEIYFGELFHEATEAMLTFLEKAVIIPNAPNRLFVEKI